MNFHVITPTEAKAIARHRAFHQAIERKAAELQSSKLLDALKVQRQASPPLAPHAIAPEAIPAEPDPPLKCARCLAIVPAIDTVKKIQNAVSEYYRVPCREIISDRRHASIILPRMVAIYLCREITPFSLPRIGHRFGGRDHSTAIHSINKIKRLILTDRDIAHDIAILLFRITGEWQ